MRFKVQILSAKLIKVGQNDFVEVEGKSLDEPGSVRVTVPLGQSVDFRVGEIVQAEVRVRRSDDP